MSQELSSELGAEGKTERAVSESEAQFRGDIENAGFSDLPASITLIAQKDPNFCNKNGIEFTIQQIKNIEGLGDPNLIKAKGSMIDPFQRITNAYGLRDRVEELVKALPPKIAEPSQTKTEAVAEEAPSDIARADWGPRA